MSPKRSDSRRTQALLITTAERLFAERGLEGVSLSEINRLAGQRNKSALHYHFGSRDGLLKAILEKHRFRLDAQRAKLLDTFGPREGLTLHDAVTVMVRPLADKLDDVENGGTHYIRIMAQLSATPHHPMNDWLFNELPPAFAEIAPILYRSIPRAPTILRMRRAQLMNGTMFHALLLQSYPSTDTADDHRAAERRELYINDLIDCICGLITAPISAESADTIERSERLGLESRATDDRLPHFGPDHDPVDQAGP
jgi:AcrR family transcriptional regulator